MAPQGTAITLHEKKTVFSAYQAMIFARHSKEENIVISSKALLCRCNSLSTRRLTLLNTSAFPHVVQFFTSTNFFLPTGLDPTVVKFLIFTLTLVLTSLCACSVAFLVSACVRTFAIANLLIGLPYVFMMVSRDVSWTATNDLSGDEVRMVVRGNWRGRGQGGVWFEDN